MRLEKRSQSSRMALLLAPVGAVVFTLLVSALLVWWAGADVAQTYGLLLRGGFGSVFALSETFTRAIPLMLTGLAAAVAFRARLFNMAPRASFTWARWRRWQWVACTAAAALTCPCRC